MALDWRVYGLLALGALAVTSVFLIAPGPVGGLEWISMHGLYRSHATEALATGRLPLWNPYTGLGRPFLADPETAVLYPPNWVCGLLGEPVGAWVFVIGHTVLGVLGMFLLGKHVGISTRPAALVALSFPLMLPVSDALLLGQVPIFATACWLPWLIWLGLSLPERASPRLVAALAMVVALMITAGSPAYVYYAGLAGGVLLIGYRGLDGRGLVRDLSVYAAGVGLGTALAGVQLLPMLEFGEHANRTASLVYASSMPTGWQSLASPWVAVESAAQGLVYCGTLIALAAPLALTRIRQPAPRALLLLVLVATLAGLGHKTPMFRVFYCFLPGMGQLRLPGRYMLLAGVGLLLLAGLGLSRPLPPRIRARALAGSAALGGGVIVLAAHAGGATWSWTALHLAWAGLGVGALAAWFSRGAGGPSARWVMLALALFAAADLGYASWRMRGVLLDPVRPPTAEGELVRELRKYGWRAGDAPPRVFLPPPAIRENSGLLHGYATVVGYAGLTPGRVWSVVHALKGVEPHFLQTNPVDPRVYTSPRRYEHLGIRLAVRDARIVLCEPGPRVWLSTRARSLPDWQACVEALVAGQDPLAETLLEGTVPRLEGPPGAARITRFQPEQVEVLIEGEGPALLVLQEAWYPGWVARVDGGAPAACRPANAWMRAVEVPAGAHRVVFSFEPASLRRGAALSLLGLLILAALLGWPRRRGLGGLSRWTESGT